VGVSASNRFRGTHQFLKNKVQGWRGCWGGFAVLISKYTDIAGLMIVIVRPRPGGMWTLIPAALFGRPFRKSVQGIGSTLFA
jgi:hypothetical protein